MITGCANHVNEPEPCEFAGSGEVLYSRDVYPILSTSCIFSGCHTTEFNYGNFTRFEDVKEKAESGKLEFMIVTGQMPHGNTTGPKYLNDCEIRTIKTWIKNGANND